MATQHTVEAGETFEEALAIGFAKSSSGIQMCHTNVHASCFNLNHAVVNAMTKSQDPGLTD